MTLLRILALLLAFNAPAMAAGVREITVPSDPHGPKIDALMWTPCPAPPADAQTLDPRLADLGVMSAVPGFTNCDIPSAALPLIVFSHGFGGSFVDHADLAEALADAGYAVVALNHPLDSAADMKHAEDMSSMTARPTDVRRLLDYVLQSSPEAVHIDPRRIAFFGFSRGGYTGLVLAGAVPDFPIWVQARLFLSHIWPSANDAPADPPGQDPRFKAFVIADPLTFFPGKGSLRTITAPIQLWSSQSGGQGVTPEKVAAVANDLPARPDFHQVPKSGHLSFLPPCAPAVAKAAPQACVDPLGFDRVAFRRQFITEVLTFFRKSLAEQQ